MHFDCSIEMECARLLVFSGLVWAVRGKLVFPPGFKFGAGSSAYQVEGAWNVSDKGESIWDRMTHTNKHQVIDGGNGDVACDSYYRWREDVEIAADIGIHFYRFSLSWPRLLPTGLPNKISKDGVEYYNNLINGLLEKGIEPMVTIYHWDLPQRLQDLGGWCNPLISDWFASYARTVFSLFGDRVKTWITINEPLMVCDGAYSAGMMAPGLLDPEMGNYLCIKNILMAHAKGWRIYDEEFRHKYHGRISMANALIWSEPNSEGDEELADLVNELANGIYLHPVYSKEGGWPPVIEKLVAERSKDLGFPYSTLPAFTKKEIELVRGTHDFFAFNYYIANTVRLAEEGEDIGPWPLDGVPLLGAVIGSNPDWPTGGPEWFRIYPEGLRKLMSWSSKKYGVMEYLITENGYASVGMELEDYDRIQYFEDHFEQILLAIKRGINVTHYTAWSLIDTFEWVEGFRIKFGLYEVDFDSAERKRTPRTSAGFYKYLIKSQRRLDSSDFKMHWDDEL